MEEFLSRGQKITDRAKVLWIKEGKLSWSREISEAALYVMEGGKGTRPALLLWSAISTAKSLETNKAERELEQTSLEAALALEMVHVYSLIHDDLPSMDNDDFRRGKPTLHKKYSEAIAVLTGDALLTGAFEVLAHAPVSDPARVNMIRELARAAGGAGMVAGQVWDIEAEKNKREDLELWTKIHDAKTGALFGAALAMGFVVGSESATSSQNIAQDLLEDARNWGIRLGRLFQMVDDRLDHGPFFKKLGEPALLEMCQSEATALSASAKNLWPSNEGLDRILDFFVHREA